jgi:hypothetical protein
MSTLVITSHFLEAKLNQSPLVPAHGFGQDHAGAIGDEPGSLSNAFGYAVYCTNLTVCIRGTCLCPCSEHSTIIIVTLHTPQILFRDVPVHYYFQTRVFSGPAVAKIYNRGGIERYSWSNRQSKSLSLPRGVTQTADPDLFT